MAEDHDAGTLRISVVADATGFTRDLRAKIREATDAVTAQVRVEFKAQVTELRRTVKDATDAVTAQIRITWNVPSRDLSRDVRAAAEKVTAKVRADVTFRISQVRTAIREATAGKTLTVAVDGKFSAAQIRRALRETTANTLLQVRVDVDIRAAQLRRAVRAAAAEAGADVKVALSVSALEKAKVKAEIDRIKGKAKVEVEVETEAARSGMAKFTGFLRGAIQGPLGFVINPSRWTALGAGVRAFGQAFAQLGRFVAIGAGIGAIGGAAVQALGAVKALLPALGALGVIPAIAFGGAVALGVMRLALSGVGEALKNVFAGKPLDPAAMDNLGASAQKLVLQVQKLKPAFDDLRKSVQNAVFANLDKDIASLAGVWLPVLKTQLTGIGVAFNGLFRDAIQFASSASFVGDVGTALGNVRLAAGNLGGVLPSILSIFADLVSVGSSFLPQLATGFNNAANSARAFVNYARESGKLHDWIQTGIDTVKQLGRILGEVGGILHDVFTAATAAGGGTLNNLEQILIKINQFTGSVQGQAALQSFFTSLSTILQAILPLVVTLAGAIGTTLAPAIAGIVTVLAPSINLVLSALQSGIAALAPGLQALAAGLGPGLVALTPGLIALGKALGDGLGSLGGVLPLVGQALSSIVVAAAPLLPLIGQLAALLLGNLARAILVLAPTVTRLVQIFVDSLSPILPQLEASFIQLATAATPLISLLGGAVADALAKLLPPILQLVPTLVASLLPALISLINIGVSLLPTLLPIATMLIDAWMPAFQQLGPMIGPLVQMLAQLLVVTTLAVIPLVQLLAPLAKLYIVNLLVPAVKALAWAMGLIGEAAGWAAKLMGGFTKWFTDWNWSAILSTIGSALSAVGAWFGRLPEMIWGALTSAWRKVTGWFSSAGTEAGAGVAGIGRWFAALPGQIGGWLAQLPALIGSAIASAATALLHGIGVIIGYAIALPILLIRAAEELPAKAQAWWSQFWTDVSTWASNGIDALVLWAKGIPDRTLAAVSSLWASAQIWWNNLWRDVGVWTSTGIDNVLTWVNALPGRALAALSGLGALLGNLLSTAWAWAKQAAVDGVNNLMNFIYGIPGRIGALGPQLWQAGANLIQSLLNGLSSLGNGLTKVAASIVNAVKGGLNWVIDKINEGIGSVDHIPGVSLPRIPRLARGAVVEEATTVTIGEDGREVVIPLTRPRRAVELARQSGLLDLLRQYGALAGGPALAGVPSAGGRVNPPRDSGGPQPAAEPTVINLYGNRLTAAEQLAALGAELAWRMRERR